MKNKTIAQLREYFEAGHITDQDIQALKDDPRKGVQKLLTTFHNKQKKQATLEKTFYNMSAYERTLYAKGHRYVAGVDEAGRGPLAGPVVAAAVILPCQFKLLELNDSKKLSNEKRKELFKVIKREAISYGVSTVDNQKIDQLNIYNATKQAMYQAIDQLQEQPSHVLIDAVPLENLSSSSDVIVKGDQKSISIAAASIIAKVTRDRLMKDIHKKYPMYHFDTNMGYGTKQHLIMLKKYGISPVHRQSYTPVQRVMMS